MIGHTTIKTDGKHWLVPDSHNYDMDLEAYKLWKSDWIQIKQEYTDVFKGRNGLKETIDFKLIREVLTPDNVWIKAVRREWWDILPEDRKRIVAVPTEQTKEDTENWNELLDIMKEAFRSNQTFREKLRLIKEAKQSFALKRKQ
jgi:hypothetical protein